MSGTTKPAVSGESDEFNPLGTVITDIRDVEPGDLFYTVSGDVGEVVETMPGRGITCQVESSFGQIWVSNNRFSHAIRPHRLPTEQGLYEAATGSLWVYDGSMWRAIRSNRKSGLKWDARAVFQPQNPGKMLETSRHAGRFPFRKVEMEP